MIQVENLQVVFGRGRHTNPALRGISFDVAAGEIYGIVGESGSGKSTVLNVLSGLLRRWSGQVTIGGRPMLGRRDRAFHKKVQMVFQDPSSSLNPSLTVEKMLSELLRVHQVVPRNKIADRCAELMDLVELPQSLLKALPRRMSGGQRQRVGIARALALEPDVLIADE